jgi:hypothetical protein
LIPGVLPGLYASFLLSVPVLGAVSFLGNLWHVGCGAMGVWARHRRFARNEA